LSISNISISRVTLFMCPLDKHRDSWVERLTNNQKAYHTVHLIIESLHCSTHPY
jgi:hypothetical protein